MSDTPATLFDAEKRDVLDRRICANVLSLLGKYIAEKSEKEEYFHNNWLEMSHVDYREYTTKIAVLRDVINDLTTALRG